LSGDDRVELGSEQFLIGADQRKELVVVYPSPLRSTRDGGHLSPPSLRRR
jgi:hypothetical protein